MSNRTDSMRIEVNHHPFFEKIPPLKSLLNICALLILYTPFFNCRLLKKDHFNLTVLKPYPSRLFVIFIPVSSVKKQLNKSVNAAYFEQFRK
jgi:hypothetical protein